MKERFFVSTNSDLLDLPFITEFLSKRSYWAKGRSKEVIQKSVENSLCFGVYTTSNQQVGFARVITDYAVFGWIMDLFIVEEHRKKGLSKMLIKEMMEHSALQGLQKWGLNTKDAHALYEQFGFSKITQPDWMMEKARKQN